MSFEQLSASLMSESHRKEHRNQQLGDAKALAASFQKQTSLQTPSNSNRGRAGRWPNTYHGRGFPGRSYPGQYRPQYNLQYRPPASVTTSPYRPPLICYNGGKNGHYARDCCSPPNPQLVQEATTPRGTGFANSAEFFESQIAQ